MDTSTDPVIPAHSHSYAQANYGANASKAFATVHQQVGFSAISGDELTIVTELSVYGSGGAEFFTVGAATASFLFTLLGPFQIPV
jgi:hypothetical protein